MKLLVNNWKSLKQGHKAERIKKDLCNKQSHLECTAYDSSKITILNNWN